MTNSTSARVFHAFVIFAYLSLICYSVYRYNSDEDASLVNYQTFHSSRSNIYPSLTMCVPNSFKEAELQKHDPNLNGTTFEKFLMGQEWNKTWLQIDYRNVTDDIMRYILNVDIKAMTSQGSVGYPYYYTKRSGTLTNVVGYNAVFNSPNIL